MPLSTANWQLLKALYRQASGLPADDQATVVHFLALRHPALSDELQALVGQEEVLDEHLHALVTLGIFDYLIDDSNTDTNTELRRLVCVVREIRSARRNRRDPVKPH
jgi:hypothetical protein